MTHYQQMQISIMTSKLKYTDCPACQQHKEDRAHILLTI